MTKLIAFLWIALIGTNFAAYYSFGLPFQTLTILAGGAFVASIYNRQLIRLLRFKDFLFVFFMLVAPAPLMLLSSRGIAIGDVTSQVLIAITFVVAAVLASRPGLDTIVRNAALLTAGVGATLNLYELLVQNVWSVSPGRSAGLYENPNYSSEAVLAFGLIFLANRSGKFTATDLLMTALVTLGVIATFSRTGILASVVLLTGAIVMRAKPRHVPRIIGGAIVIALLAAGFVTYVIRNVTLSVEASQRLYSLIEGGGVGDYQQDRGLLALEWMELFWKNPILGGGVYTIFDGKDGPHNMFVAMMVDYGMVGLAIYLFLIARLVALWHGGEPALGRIIILYAGWLILFSFASHNLLLNTATTVVLGIVVAQAFRSRTTIQPAVPS